MRKRQKTEAGRGRPPGPVPPTRSAGRAYRASCGSGPGWPMASLHGLSELRQETPARKTASASFPPPAPDSSRGTRPRAAPGTLLPLPPLLWTPWPVTVWAGERPGGGDDGPSPCRPTPLCKEEPAARRAGQRRVAWGVATTNHAPCSACGGRGRSLCRPRPPLAPPPCCTVGGRILTSSTPKRLTPYPQVASRPLKKGERISKGRSVRGLALLELASHRGPQWGRDPGRGGAGPLMGWGGARRSVGVAAPTFGTSWGRAPADSLQPGLI